MPRQLETEPFHQRVIRCYRETKRLLSKLYTFQSLFHSAFRVRAASGPVG